MPRSGNEQPIPAGNSNETRRKNPPPSTRRYSEARPRSLRPFDLRPGNGLLGDPSLRDAPERPKARSPPLLRSNTQTACFKFPRSLPITCSLGVDVFFMTKAEYHVALPQSGLPSHLLLFGWLGIRPAPFLTTQDQHFNVLIQENAAAEQSNGGDGHISYCDKEPTAGFE